MRGDKTLIEMKAKIERAIYEASMALDNNNWAGWLSLCDEEFNYKITAFSPEINKDMIYFEHNKGELANLLDMLPKHNTDHSPLFRHTSVYTVDVSESGTEARATSSVVVFQNMLDGVNSHLDSGESRLFLVGRYHDTFTITDGVVKFVTRETRLENRRLDKGSHYPI